VAGWRDSIRSEYRDQEQLRLQDKVAQAARGKSYRRRARSRYRRSAGGGLHSIIPRNRVSSPYARVLIEDFADRRKCRDGTVSRRARDAEQAHCSSVQRDGIASWSGCFFGTTLFPAELPDPPFRGISVARRSGRPGSIIFRSLRFSDCFLGPGEYALHTVGTLDGHFDLLHTHDYNTFDCTKSLLC